MNPTRFCLSFLLMLVVPAASAQTTYYLSPQGDDASPGTAADAPWQTFGHAFSQLESGDTLLLLNGVYTPDATGRFNADGYADARSGTEAQPITVKAQNERQAHIKGDGQDAAILVQNLAWWHLEGLRASNQDDSTATKGGEGVKLINTRHMTIRRGLFHNSNRERNAQMVMIVLSRDVLVEESEIYNFHRNGFEAYRSENVTFRRSYANARDYIDDGGDSAFKAYYGSNFLTENCISEGGTHGFSSSSGLSTRPVDPDWLADHPPSELEGYAYFDRLEATSVRPSGQHLRYFGNISLNDERSGAMDSRNLGGEKGHGVQMIKDVLYRNHLAIGSTNRAYLSRAVGDLTLKNVTVLNTKGPAFASNLNPQHKVGPGQYQWFSCATGGGCRFHFANWLVAGTAGSVFDEVPPNDANLDFLAEYVNFYDTDGLGTEEAPSDDEGQIRQSMREQPTGMGLSEGECAVFIPKRSKMSGVGKNRADIGANILYRYQDGELTDEELWDPETGAFPHGAVIEGVNDVAGASLMDVHERLNVNTNGCRLPYSE